MKQIALTLSLLFLFALGACSSGQVKDEQRQQPKRIERDAFEFRNPRL